MLSKFESSILSDNDCGGASTVRGLKFSKMLALAMLLTMCCSLSATAEMPQTDQVLKGKVEQRDKPVRLQRPGTPVLESSKGATSAKTASASAVNSATMGLGSDDFLFNFKKGTGKSDNIGSAKSGGPLEGEAESGELVIAWEQWHKRVCEAIFQKWRVNGNLPGVAHVRLHFTRDRHVEVTVEDVHIDDSVYSVLPVGEPATPEDLQEEFAAQILDSVSPLDGSPILDFPAKSKRRAVTFTPAFRGTRGPANFTWKKDDYEHVQQ